MITIDAFFAKLVSYVKSRTSAKYNLVGEVSTYLDGMVKLGEIAVRILISRELILNLWFLFELSIRFSGEILGEWLFVND